MTAKLHQIAEADVTFLASGGTEPLTLTSLGAGAGRQADRYDFGAITTARGGWFSWWFFCQFADASFAVGEQVDIYWKEYHQGGVHATNDDGDGDAALSNEDKLLNLRYLDSLVIDEDSATPEFACANKGSPVWLPHRYGMPVIWNDTASAFSSTAAEHGFILTETVPQAQDT